MRIVKELKQGEVDPSKAFPRWAVKWLFNRYKTAVLRAWELRRDLRASIMEYSSLYGSEYGEYSVAEWVISMSREMRDLNRERGQRLKERV